MAVVVVVSKAVEMIVIMIIAAFPNLHYDYTTKTAVANNKAIILLLRILLYSFRFFFYKHTHTHSSGNTIVIRKIKITEPRRAEPSRT